MDDAYICPYSINWPCDGSQVPKGESKKIKDPTPEIKTLFKYLNFLLKMMLSLCGRGLYFAGMDSQVLRPMITAFCFPVTKKKRMNEVEYWKDCAINMACVLNVSYNNVNGLTLCWFFIQR